MTRSEALKKIGLISKELNIPIYVIRFWEKKINILKPIRKPNGTRYYSSCQMEILKEIKFLLQKKKYSIEGVNLYFKEKNQINDPSEKQIIINEIEELIVEIRNTISNGA
jgi:DNA-binding transcriptional MerR regulator